MLHQLNLSELVPIFIREELNLQLNKETIKIFALLSLCKYINIQ